jgi:hypothetical protein
VIAAGVFLRALHHFVVVLAPEHLATRTLDPLIHLPPP